VGVKEKPDIIDIIERKRLQWYGHIIPLNPELNPICYLLALLAHQFLHVSRIRVKSLPLRLLLSYIYVAHTGRSPAEIVGLNPTGGMDICLL